MELPKIVNMMDVLEENEALLSILGTRAAAT